MGAIDGADRVAGDRVGVKIRFGQRLVDAALIGAQRAAALQQEGDALEIGPRLRYGRGRLRHLTGNS